MARAVHFRDALCNDKHALKGLPDIKHTYCLDEQAVPLDVHGKNGNRQVIKRMLEEKLVIIISQKNMLDRIIGFTGL